MPRLLLVISLLACICSSPSVRAQNRPPGIDDRVIVNDPQQVHELSLLDYSRLLGRLTAIEPDSIDFQLRGGEVLRLASTQIRTLRVIEDRYFDGEGRSLGRQFDGAYYPLAEMSYEKTALPPTAKSQLRIVGLAYASYERNFSEHFQAGLGSVGLVALTTSARLRATLAPNLHAGVVYQGLIPVLQLAIDGGQPELLSDLSAVVTVGDENQFFNFGGGMLGSSFGDGVLSQFRVGLGGRIASRSHLFAEGIAISGNDNNFTVLPSVSWTTWRRQHRFKLGLVTVLIDQEEFFPLVLPVLSYVRYFGRLD